MWSYGHAMSTQNIVFDIQSHTHFHDGQMHSHEHPEGAHEHYDHGDHTDSSVIDLFFCALTDYGHFLWDIEHGEHGIHFSLGLSSSDLLKDLADGSGTIPVHPFIEKFQLDLEQTLFEEKPAKTLVSDQHLHSIDLVHQSPFRGPPSISC